MKFYSWMILIMICLASLAACKTTDADNNQAEFSPPPESTVSSDVADRVNRP
jgi:hypothetical protein